MRRCLIVLVVVACGCGQAAEEPLVSEIVTADASFDGTPDAFFGVDAPADGEQADQHGADAAKADTSALDTGPWTPQPCTDAGDCNSGFCVWGAAGKECALTCIETCPQDYACVLSTGSSGDVSSICVPRHPRICEPCHADADCSSALGASKSLCVPYRKDGVLIGGFCGSACDDSAQCPFGYGCVGVQSVNGAKAKQCRKVTSEGCGCDARARDLALTTSCEAKNAQGACTGKRTCGKDGVLSACDAPAAVTEVCDGTDQDCDGLIDEGGDEACGDGNTCTYDHCKEGACTHPIAPGTCDDDNACSATDSCTDGACGGVAIDCDDGKVCTADSCAPATGCAHLPAAGTPCDDGDICTLADACDGTATCLPGVATVCDDGNICTTDSCAAATGCVFAANTASCDDGDACTDTDTCQNAGCAGKKRVCKDDNLCTDDGCDPATGCTFGTNMLGCEDGDVCTLDDACKDKVCVAGQAKVCGDGNACTNDGCSPKTGCTFTNTAQASPCSDGNLCSIVDGCLGGVCLAFAVTKCDDGNPCTNDGCNPQSGCAWSSSTEPCDDGNACTSQDRCKGGACLPGAATVCDDGNVCTHDSCAPAIGCQTKPNTAACDDGDACTASDTCAAAVCGPGKAVGCDDANVCTTEACDSSKGCVHTANSAACDDNDACTMGDVCAASACKPGAKVPCSDGKLCTDDGCDAGTGCTFIANTLACDDNDACTKGDVCAASACKPGAKVPCSDGKLCTDDGCAAATGCTFVANTLACDDNDACTKGDVCAASACKSGKPVTCDDTNPCTKDTCESGSGCKASKLADGTSCGADKQCKAGVCTLQPLGTKANPAQSCKQIYDTGTSKSDGTYWLDPNGGSHGDAFSATCLMSMAGGGWTKLYPNVASSLHGGTTKEYLYVYGGNWYRSPKTTLVWSWSSGKQLTGSYAYKKGGSTSAYTCHGSKESPTWGVGCSNGGGGTAKTLTYYSKNPSAAQGTVCQDQPGAICGCACRSNTTMYVRGY